MPPFSPASRQWLALPHELPCLPTRGSARDFRHRPAETLANALRLFHWTIAKKTLELPAELRCALVANSIRCNRSAKSIMENQHAGLVKPNRFQILQRRTGRHRLEGLWCNLRPTGISVGLRLAE